MGLTRQATGSAASKDISGAGREPGERVVALAGNPNTGKSTVFNRLTGLNQHTGNWPGKTVTNARGRYRHGGTGYLLVDLPGTYSLLANSGEEQVARDFICSGQADVTVVVTDATCLERNFNLVLQVLEITDRVVVCVNLLDEARRKKIHIDIEQLGRELGVPVIGASARSGEGLAALKGAIAAIAAGLRTQPRQVAYPPALKDIAANAPYLRFQAAVQSASETQGLLDGVATSIVRTAERIFKRTVRGPAAAGNSRERKIDAIVTSRVFGYPIMLGLLAVVFWLSIAGANYPSQWLAALLFRGEDLLAGLGIWARLQPWLYGVLIEGMYRTLAWVVSVMLPPMAIFFPLFTLLEDLGYLPRVAFNLDHCFKRAQAHGKQALTMCMGFGCNAAGVTACRIIDSPRERLVAILTNNFVPCNGRFPILIILATAFFAAAPLGSLAAVVAVLMAVLLGVGMTLFISLVLSRTVLKGVASSFTLEMPPYRLPQVGKVIVRSLFDRTLFVLARAMAVAAPAGVVIWLMANLGWGGVSLLARGSQLLQPLGWLMGLDGAILLGFLLGFPANEIVIPIIVMAYLASGSLQEPASSAAVYQLFTANGWTWLTAVNTMLFALFHFPCGTTLWTIYKETRSRKWTGLALLIPTVVGVVVCVAIAGLARLLGLVL